MSRRTKLLITAIFLALLSIPAAYVVLTWHPRNPLRFRQLEEKAITYPHLFAPGSSAGKEHYSTMLVEVRNTSLTTVLLVSGHFNGKSSEGKGTFYAEGRAPRPAEGYFIAPGGTIQIPFEGQVLSAEDLKQLQAGKLRPREGTMRYRWDSQIRVSIAMACYWLRERLPVTLADHLPYSSPFEDAIEVDMDLPPPPAPRVDTHPR